LSIELIIQHEDRWTWIGWRNGEDSFVTQKYSKGTSDMLRLAVLFLAIVFPALANEDLRCKEWAVPAVSWKAYELQSFQYSAKVQLFENGNKGTEIILNNPTDQTIERIDWVNYTGESEMVAVNIPPRATFAENFLHVTPPKKGAQIELMYREEDEPECLEFFEDEEVAQLPIYDSCLASRMPSGTVEREVKDSVIRTCTRIAANPSFWNRLRYNSW